jgi:hypothetical protein
VTVGTRHAIRCDCGTPRLPGALQRSILCDWVGTGLTEAAGSCAFVADEVDAAARTDNVYNYYDPRFFQLRLCVHCQEVFHRDGQFRVRHLWFVSSPSSDLALCLQAEFPLFMCTLCVRTHAAHLPYFTAAAALSAPDRPVLGVCWWW